MHNCLGTASDVAMPPKTFLSTSHLKHIHTVLCFAIFCNSLTFLREVRVEKQMFLEKYCFRFATNIQKRIQRFHKFSNLKL